MLPHAGKPLPSGTRWLRVLSEDEAARAQGFFWNARGDRFFCDHATAIARRLRSERPLQERYEPFLYRAMLEARA